VLGTGVALANFPSGGKIAVKWQISSHAAQTILVGPFGSEALAKTELRKKMRTEVLNENSILDSGMVDVSGLTKIARFYKWTNNAQGDEIEIETVSKVENGVVV
jgi:hypothetical protein